MSKRTLGQRPKHLPLRTCIVCREVAGKRALVRVVRTATGVEVDSTGKKAGRGAYVHATRRCWEQVLKGNRLEQALRTKLKAEDRAVLQEFGRALPEGDDEPPTGHTEAAITLAGNHTVNQDR